MDEITIAVCIFITGIVIGALLFSGSNGSQQARPLGGGIITTTSQGDLCRQGQDKSCESEKLLTGKLPPTPQRPPNYQHGK